MTTNVTVIAGIMSVMEQVIVTTVMVIMMMVLRDNMKIVLVGAAIVMVI